jgi:uncharacterized protein YfkK (UPF0435 family)
MKTEETKKFNKSKFIRERPNMTPADISAAAEALGQTISPGTVWTLRSSDKRKAAGKATTKGKKAQAKVAKTRVKKVKVPKENADGSFNKSAFIRKNSKLSASEISAAAKELGQEISTTMVHSIRSSDKKKSGDEASKKVSKKSVRQLKSNSANPGVPGRSSVSFDPSDPVARKFIAKALRAYA